jgi:hypothetical protein
MIQINIHLIIQSDLGSKDAELRGTARIGLMALNPT